MATAKVATRENSCVIRKPLDAQLRDFVECEIKKSDQQARGGPTPAVCGNREFRDDPFRVESQMREYPGNKVFDLFLGEAIQKKVGDDEIVTASVRGKTANVGMKRPQPLGGIGGGFSNSATQLCQHGGAGIDCVDLDCAVGREQPRGESAISIPENQGLLRAGTLRQEMKSAAFQRGAETAIFHPTIDSRQRIEVGREAIR